MLDKGTLDKGLITELDSLRPYPLDYSPRPPVPELSPPKPLARANQIRQLLSPLTDTKPIAPTPYKYFTFHFYSPNDVPKAMNFP